MSEPSPYIQANLEAKVTQLMEVCVEKDWTIQGLNRTIEEQKQLVAERYRQLAALQTEFLKLLRLLNRVPHHGPQGSSFLPLPPPGCWSDCVACEYEKFKAMPTV